MKIEADKIRFRKRKVFKIRFDLESRSNSALVSTWSCVSPHLRNRHAGSQITVSTNFSQDASSPCTYRPNMLKLLPQYSVQASWRIPQTNWLTPTIIPYPNIEWHRLLMQFVWFESTVLLRYPNVDSLPEISCMCSSLHSEAGDTSCMTLSWVSPEILKWAYGEKQ